MASEARASVSTRGGRVGAAAGGRQQRIAPLYERLPRGPHRLDPEQVRHHQRVRIHGAMVEAVAEKGYESTSVKQVIGLAGVSRRSFYEHFANKQECFLATFDLLVSSGVERMTGACREGGDQLDDRLAAALRELAVTMGEGPKAATLVVVESQAAGAAGLQRLRMAIATCEKLLCQSFTAKTTGALPAPIVRGVAGGLHGMMAARLREASTLDARQLGDDMLRWTLLFQTPAAARMTKHLAERLPRSIRESSSRNGSRPDTPTVSAVQAAGDERERLLLSVLRLARSVEYRELSAPQIADEARLPVDAFFELFADKEECFLAALDAFGAELLAIAAAHPTQSDDWPRAVRRVLRELMRYFAEHPLYARTIAELAFAAGADAIARNLELARDVATLLTAGAPGPAPDGVGSELIAGAILHTIRCHVAASRVPLLPALSDYLAYVVLAPYIGADAAAKAVGEELA